MWIAAKWFYRHIAEELERRVCTFFCALTGTDQRVTRWARRGPSPSHRAPVTSLTPTAGLSVRLAAALGDGEQALAQGDLAAACRAFASAAQLAPADVPVALALANTHALLGEAAERRRVLGAAVADGDWHEVTVAYALGGALLEAGLPHEAAVVLEYVRRHAPHDPAALSALAGALRAAGEPGRAWPLVKTALERAPHAGAVLLTAAQVRHDLGDLLGALTWLDKAERARPDHAPTRLQRAYTSLLRAPSATGWALFEHRPLPAPATAARPWHGEPLPGSSVLVTAEQGVGDQFQFLRFVPDLVTRGAARVIVTAHASVVPLLQANGLDAVPRGTEPNTDWHVPLLSLPHRLGTGAELYGDRVPYLRAPDVPTPPLPEARGTRRLGLVWAGNPDFPGRVTRDLDPALLPTLLDTPGVAWVSLQQGAAGELDLPGLHRLPPLVDWGTTAALLTQLDGLVTTDTGIAHLAGAMGVPTWLLAAKVPDWRWGLTGTRCGWYPSVTICRPGKRGNWRDTTAVLTRYLRDR